MLTEDLNIYEYEEVLTGKKQDFSVSFKGTPRENRIEVGNIWRYAVHNILKWDCQQAAEYLTDDIVDKLLLNKTFVGIDFDRGHTYISDYRFVLQYAFPNEVKFDERAQTIAEYEHVAKLGKWSGSKEPYKYPKRFFLNQEGIRRAEILLRYAINTYLSDCSVYELYEFFADDVRATYWLQRKKLGTPIKLIYDNPLEYLHASLPAALRDNMAYHNFLIQKELEKLSADNATQPAPA
jgi:hypothetical protein